jgi:hypothetical protein
MGRGVWVPAFAGTTRGVIFSGRMVGLACCAAVAYANSFPLCPPRSMVAGDGIARPPGQSRARPWRHPYPRLLIHMSALARTTDASRGSREVRFVPLADSCAAARRIPARSPRRHGQGRTRQTSPSGLAALRLIASRHFTRACRSFAEYRLSMPDVQLRNWARSNWKCAYWA